MPNWAFFLMRLSLGVAASVAMTWIGWKIGGFAFALIGFLFSMPVIGVAIAKPLVEVVDEGFGWFKAQPMQKWQGIFYAFDGVQVRVVEEGGKLWFAADDVIKATGIKAVGGALPESRVIKELGLACLQIADVEALLNRHRSEKSGRFSLWARREVQTPWERKRG